MEYIGIGVHKGERQVCVGGGGRGGVLERRIATKRARLAELLGTRPKSRILLEFSTESEWVVWCLEELGHEVVDVADPKLSMPCVGDGNGSKRTPSSRGMTTPSGTSEWKCGVTCNVEPKN